MTPSPHMASFPQVLKAAILGGSTVLAYTGGLQKWCWEGDLGAFQGLLLPLLYKQLYYCTSGYTLSINIMLIITAGCPIQRIVCRRTIFNPYMLIDQSR